MITKGKKTVEYPIITMEKKGRLYLTRDLVSQILFLHSAIGKTEWSGVLMYDVVSGSPSTPEKFILRAEQIFLMDIGTSGYTEYDYSEDIIDLYDNVEGSMDMKTGHIHTHHSMDAFFSGTDMSELHENVDKYNYYLSLIVNFSGQFKAKVAFLSNSEVKSKMTMIDDNGKLKLFTLKKKEKSMVIVDMEILLDYQEEFFYDRYTQVVKAIQKKKEEAEKNQVTKYSSSNNYDNQLTLPEFKNSFSSVKLDDVDPKNLSDKEIAMLAKNIISITPSLDETRNVYILLHLLTESKGNTSPDDIEFYYDYLSLNLESILEAFFDCDIAPDETEIVIKEVVAYLETFAGNVKISEITRGIQKVLMDYARFKKQFEVEEENLDAELKTIENEINRC
jgi:hypothetical protein